MNEQDPLQFYLKTAVQYRSDLPGDHLTEDQMERYYRQGKFQALDESFVHLHLTECAQCIARFKDIRDFFGPQRPDEEDTMDLDADRMWNALRFRLGPGRGRQPVVAASNRQRWPAPILIPLAASLLLAVTAGMVWIARLHNQQRESGREFQSERTALLAQLKDAVQENGRIRDQAEAAKKEYDQKLAENGKRSEGQPKNTSAAGLAAAPAINVPIFDVFSDQAVQRSAGSGASPSGSNDIHIPPRAANFVLILNADGLARDQSYRVEIVDQSNQVIWRGSGMRQDETGNFSLLLSRSNTAPGSYRVRLYPREAAARQPVAEYKIRINR
jgi:hypothetical protein